MSNPQTISQLLDLINTAWQLWRVSLPIDKAELEAKPDGGWSLKDVMAHISWHEQEMINVVRAKALVASEWWMLPLDERNEKIRQLYADDVVEDVIARLDATHTELLKALPALEDADLHDPARFEGMPAEWEPWSLIANNTYEHYEAHSQ